MKIDETPDERVAAALTNLIFVLEKFAQRLEACEQRRIHATVGLQMLLLCDPKLATVDGLGSIRRKQRGNIGHLARGNRHGLESSHRSIRRVKLEARVYANLAGEQDDEEWICSLVPKPLVNQPRLTCIPDLRKMNCGAISAFGRRAEEKSAFGARLTRRPHQMQVFRCNQRPIALAVKLGVGVAKRSSEFGEEHGLEKRRLIDARTRAPCKFGPLP